MQDTTTMTAAITTENLIHKMSFVLYGPNFGEHAELMKRDMYRFLRARNDQFISRQAVKNWFDKGSKPSRPDALEFLYLYLLNAVQRGSLNSDQKKVYDQIQSFFKNKDREEVEISDGVRFYRPSITRKETYGVLNITVQSDAQELLNDFSGEYALFHRRLIEDVDGDVAVERLSVQRRSLSLLGRIDFLDAFSVPQSFEGEFFRIGSMIWYIGRLSRATDEPDRLRVMAFRRTGKERAPYDALKWGLIMSDIPHPSAHIPASCRVVLLKLDKYGDSGPQIGPVDAKAKSGLEWQTILRLIDNNTTAVSSQNTVEPLDKLEIFNENILKTDHRTIERACELFERGRFRTFW